MTELTDKLEIYEKHIDGNIVNYFAFASEWYSKCGRGIVVTYWQQHSADAFKVEYLKADEFTVELRPQTVEYLETYNPRTQFVIGIRVEVEKEIKLMFKMVDISCYLGGGLSLDPVGEELVEIAAFFQLES